MAGNLGTVLDASKNALQKGAAQYWTPLDYAAALAIPLSAYRGTLVDLNCGSGNLLAGAANSTTSTLLAFDIDSRMTVPKLSNLFAPLATAPPPEPAPQPSFFGLVGRRSISTATRKSSPNPAAPAVCRWVPAPEDHSVQRVRGVGDVTKLFPLLEDAGAQFDCILANPPFSLKWKVDSLAKNALDSTLATFRMQARLMSPVGEALLICNAATADRLLATEEGIAKCWLWLTLPNFFPGLRHDMRVAVLYMAGQHDTGPRRVELASADLADLIPTMQKFHVERHDAGLGCWGKSTARRNQASIFAACVEELGRLPGAKPDYNIYLSPEGRILTYLNSFQHYAASVSREAATQLASLTQRHPMELVVQAPTRRTLLEAVASPLWRVHPDVPAAVMAAVNAYNAARAPFVALNPVMRLGYCDEEDAITCSHAWLDFQPGQSYRLTTRTATGGRTEKRKRLDATDEVVITTGECLIIEVDPGTGGKIAFTADPKFHTFDSYPLQTLLAHFDIPDVLDVARLDHQEYEKNKLLLLGLQH
jgi:hypothetical protein